MPGIQIVVDPGEAELAFSKANGFNVFAPLKHSTSQREVQWGANVDSEGDVAAAGRDLNTEITPHLRLFGTTEEQFRERQVAFEQKLHKIGREGGILRLIYPDGSWIDWPIRAVTGGERLLDNRFVHHKRTEDEITFVCAPFGEGEEVLVGEFEGEAKRALECVIEDVGGSAPALGRMEVTSPEADIWELKWGRDSRRFSEAPTAKSQYAATALLPLGGAVATTATIEGKAGTPVVLQSTLSPNWTAMLSTNLIDYPVGNAITALTHEGTYEVLVWLFMPATNTGEVGIGFEYGVGDLSRRTEMDPLYFPADHPREGKVVQVVVGQVFLQAPGRGPHQWEGRLLASSTSTGDDLYVLDIGLRPLTEGNGRIAVTPALSQPAALLARDEFNQSAGNLHEKLIASAGGITGQASPSTVEDDGSVGSVVWSEVANAKTINNVGSTAKSTGEPNNTHRLKLTSLGFAIPGTSIVSGILVEVVRGSGGGGLLSPEITDNEVKLLKAGASTGSEHARLGVEWPLFFASAYYGSPTDLWGTTWTPAQINASNFGLGISAKFVSGIGLALIDGIRITVFYEESGVQKWATNGDAVDFAVETTGHTVQRSEVSDADINTGRYAVAGTTVTSDVVVGIKAKRTLTLAAGERVRQGPLARYVDNSNWLFFGSDFEASVGATTDALRVVKRVAGTVTELARVAVPISADYVSFWLKVDQRGRYLCWGALLSGGAPRLLLAGQDSDLAAGAALDDGKAGFYDAKTGAAACTRNYDQFVVWIPPLQATIYQGLRLELTHDLCRREVLGGGVWADVDPDGDYLKLEPAGLEHRKNRIVLVASPHDPELMGVGVTPPKLNVKFYAKPRYRTVPDPA